MPSTAAGLGADEDAEARGRDVDACVRPRFARGDPCVREAAIFFEERLGDRGSVPRGEAGGIEGRDLADRASALGELRYGGGPRRGDRREGADTADVNASTIAIIREPSGSFWPMRS